MAHNPFATATPAQTTAQFGANPFIYDVIPSEVIKTVEINPDTNKVVIENVDAISAEYDVTETAAFILEFYAAVETAIDNNNPTLIDSFFQSAVDNGRLTAV